MLGENHQKAQKLSSQAAMLMRDGRIEEARDLYAEAAELEEAALKSFPENKGRTFGILAISAVALYYKSKDYASATHLAEDLLSSSHLAEFARLQIQEIFDEIRGGGNAQIPFLVGDWIIDRNNPGQPGQYTGKWRMAGPHIMVQLSYPGGGTAYRPFSSLEAM
ncbi:MAG: hypothetical protein JRJ85_16690, partial [Deltaproteobacteria bacterium]|nr:hypothetical protein [Deltaproteobacteria bacterium]